jgi:hypothetical protein
MHRCQPTVLAKFVSLHEKLTETLYFLVVTPYSGSVIHNENVYEFLWVLNFFRFLLKIHSCWPKLLGKISSLRQKLTEAQYFLAVKPIFQIGYT